MKQYLDLLQDILDTGTPKPPARENMPGSISLFGPQIEMNLASGFPLLTTKKINFNHISTELLWFLRGDTNIKYLIDNGCNIWNEDAYQYYTNLMKKCFPNQPHLIHDFDTFLVYTVNTIPCTNLRDADYKYGDCGFQYGKVWRKWAYGDYIGGGKHAFKVDQIKNVINSLKKNPESRRHIVTAIDPAHDNDLALYWCHCMFQFNCRPMSIEDRNLWFHINLNGRNPSGKRDWKEHELDQQHIPKYYLDCKMYQRSADVLLGVPYNIASYALLTHFIAKICNMVPGKYIHSFGDVHIYDNHIDAVNMQLTRTPGELPKLKFSEYLNIQIDKFNGDNVGVNDYGYFNHLDNFIGSLSPADFTVEDYNPQERIKAKLSTGLK